MATAELRTFIEDRLRVLDSSLDLSPGSPAQTEFIDPVIEYLGTDPFETDIDKFMTDRLSQEFPDIFAGDPSAYRDFFIKPLIIFLEPFKRETQSIKRNQSLRDPSLLSDDDADALVANWFDSRNTGGYAQGTVRTYFTNPTNVQVELTTRYYTADGKSYYPATPVSVTAEEMVFNRQGSLYFADIQVRAESTGSSFNIDVEQIVGVEGLFGVAKVSNLRKITDGSDTLSTEALIAQTEASLTERSLTNPRGITARVRSVFKDEVRAVQALGAKSPEMLRDYLIGTSSGDTWATGSVTLYGTIALFQCRFRTEKNLDYVPSAGDRLVLYSASWSPQVVTFTIEEVLGAPFAGGPGFGLAYLLRWSGTPPTVPASLDGQVVEGGMVRNTTIAIASPDAIGTDIVVESGKVHVFGRTDVYVRPVSVPESKAVLSSLVDESPIVERLGLTTAFPAENRFRDTGIDFDAEGVLPGDTLLIETGELAGTYSIAGVDGNDLIVSTVLQKSVTDPMRYRVARTVLVRLFDPKIPKLPFGTTATNDLQTLIGSTKVEVGVNVVDFGVRVGDTLRLLTGKDAGDYIVTAFDAALGGRGILLDRSMTASAGNLSYEIFTPLEKVERPLVRLKELMLLDAAKKSTGVQIPPAEPVAVIPVGEFTTARFDGTSHLRSGFVLPDMTGYVEDFGQLSADVAAAAVLGNDRRYSLQIDSKEGGTYKAMAFQDGSEGELLFPPDAFGSCSYFLATVEDTGASLPPYEDPRPGQALTLKDGPNAGSYLIKKVRKFKYRDAGANDLWVYFIQIHGTFPVDIFRQLIAFLDDTLVSPIPKIDWTASTLFPQIFTNFYASLGDSMRQGLINLVGGGSPPSAEALQAVAEGLTSTRYEWGIPAHGILRTLFQQPTLLQQHTADSANPTVFEYTTASGAVMTFRPDPSRYLSHPILPAVGVTEVEPLFYPRDLQSSAGPNSSVTFSTSDKPTVFALGVQAGDVLVVHERVTEVDGVIVRTVADTPRLVAETGSPFSAAMVGDLIFLEEGQDAGGYVVSAVESANTILVDRSPTTSSPGVLRKSSSASWGYDVGTSRDIITVPATEGLQDNTNFFNGLVGKWVTLTNVPCDPNDAYWQGSYEITEVFTSGGSILGAVVARSGNFPAGPIADGHIIVTDAPLSAPQAVSGAVSGPGTETVAGVPIRLYRDVPTEYPITTVTDSGTVSSIVVTGAVPISYGQPYSIRRPNIRRINPQAMAESQQGPFFYCDTTVVSLTPNPSANLKLGAYLTMKEGSYESFGYRHSVTDPAVSYSMREDGYLTLPTSVLPVFADDRKDNELSTLGSPVQVTYEKSDVVKRLQDFLDSGEDRSTAGDLLARHFLPAYITYEATYVGGSDTSVVAKDITDYINTLVVESPLDVSQVQSLIEKRGGDPITPTTVNSLVHDWRRRAWAEFSQNQLGPSTTVPYYGTPRVTFYIPGPDVSGQDVIPYGEHIKLVKT